MLNLPQKFQSDIQGKDTHLVPLINIDDRIYLSTNKISLDNVYSPLVKTLGSLNESIDVTNKNFKISSVTLSFYNYEYNDNYLSHQLFAPSVMNKKLTIYLKSQSADSIDDCLLVYSGYIKDIKENVDLVNIEIEDKTEDTLHKDLPIEFIKDDIDLPDKYKNKRVPMVYGFVDKAPCVYYNLYQTAIENGSTKYSITPDSFAIGSITNPSVFDNDSYLTIRENATLFAEQSEGTLYESIPSEQFYIFSNMIFVDKNVSNYAVNDLEGNVGSVNTSPIGYNYVEVENTSDVVFSGGSYTIRYYDNGFRENTTTIQMFEDINSENAASEIDGAYIDVKNFTDMPSFIADGEYWAWGKIGFWQIDETTLFPYQPVGENIINFESKEFCSENNVLKQLDIDADDSKEIKQIVTLEFDLETIAELHGNYVGTDPITYPRLFFKWTDNTSEIWDIDDSDQTGDIFIKSGTTDNLYTKNITNNIFTIGCREFVDGEFVFRNQNGTLQYLKLNELKINRIAILKDFIKYDIYANVSGRVDDVAGTYTGTQEWTSEERQNYYEGRTRETGVTPYKPVKKPIKVVDPIKQIKPLETLKTPVIKKETKY